MVLGGPAGGPAAADHRRRVPAAGPSRRSTSPTWSSPTRPTSSTRSRRRPTTSRRCTRRTSPAPTTSRRRASTTSWSTTPATTRRTTSTPSPSRRRRWPTPTRTPGTPPAPTRSAIGAGQDGYVSYQGDHGAYKVNVPAGSKIIEIQLDYTGTRSRAASPSTSTSPTGPPWSTSTWRCRAPPPTLLKRAGVVSTGADYCIIVRDSQDRAADLQNKYHIAATVIAEPDSERADDAQRHPHGGDRRQRRRLAHRLHRLDRRRRLVQGGADAGPAHGAPRPGGREQAPARHEDRLPAHDHAPAAPGSGDSCAYLTGTKTCTLPTDCDSNVCQRGRCALECESNLDCASHFCSAGACAGGGECLPEGQCSVTQFIIPYDATKPNDVHTVQPVVRRHAPTCSSTTRTARRSTTTRPRTRSPSRRTPSPTREPDNFYNPFLTLESPDTDPDDVIAKNFDFGRTASGNSATGYISYEGDIDLFYFANPCGSGLCSIKVDVSTSSSLDLVFFGYDDERLGAQLLVAAPGQRLRPSATTARSAASSRGPPCRSSCASGTTRAGTTRTATPSPSPAWPGAASGASRTRAAPASRAASERRPTCVMPVACGLAALLGTAALFGCGGGHGGNPDGGKQHDANHADVPPVVEAGLEPGQGRRPERGPPARDGAGARRQASGVVYYRTTRPGRHVHAGDPPAPGQPVRHRLRLREGRRHLRQGGGRDRQPAQPPGRRPVLRRRGNPGIAYMGGTEAAYRCGGTDTMLARRTGAERLDRHHRRRRRHRRPGDERQLPGRRRAVRRLPGHLPRRGRRRHLAVARLLRQRSRWSSTRTSTSASPRTTSRRPTWSSRGRRVAWTSTRSAAAASTPRSWSRTTATRASPTTRRAPTPAASGRRRRTATGWHRRRRAVRISIGYRLGYARAGAQHGVAYYPPAAGHPGRRAEALVRGVAPEQRVGDGGDRRRRRRHGPVPVAGLRRRRRAVHRLLPLPQPVRPEHPRLRPVDRTG